MLRRLGTVMIIAAITLVALEGAVRLIPSAIPLRLLQHFESGLRVSIADRLGLPNQLRVRYYARDDGGPPLRTYLPHISLNEEALNRETSVVIRTDENGFCNPERAGSRPSRYDIVAIGDSFTWCTSVAEDATWPWQLAQGSGLEAYNLGSPNLGLHEYLQLLKGYGLDKCPSYVVMATYEGNDLRDALKYERYALTDPEAASGEPPAPSLLDSLRESALGRNSYVVNLILAAIVEYSGREPAARPSDLAIRYFDKSAVNFRYAFRFEDGERPFNVDNSDRDEVIHAVVLEQGTIDLTAFDGALTSFMDLAARHGFTPVVLYIPSAYTAYADFVQFEDAKLQELMPRYSDRLRRYFAEAASRFGFTFLDATPALQQAARELQGKELLYFATNVHLTPAGHRVVADAIGKHLETLLITALPPDRPECRGS